MAFFDVVEDITRYEQGEMSFDETVAFFQRLYYSRLYLSLQGNYPRTMAHLIEEGCIHVRVR